MQQDIQTNGPIPPPTITLSAFLQTVAAKINRHHEGEVSPVVLRGVPIKKSGVNPIYGGFVYALLRDPRTGDTIEAKVPEEMLQDVNWGREVIVTGFFRYRVASKGEVKPEFRVDSFLPIAGKAMLAKHELFARWDKAITRPKRDIRSALLGTRPRIVLISGVTSVAIEDIQTQLKETQDDVELDVRRVSLSRPEEVIRELRQSSDAKIVVLTRGGGDDIHDLDTEGLIEAVAASPSPVVVAVGHASDQKQLVVGRVADACFPTPTAFGTWLCETLRQGRLQSELLLAAKQQQDSKQLLEQVTLLRDQNRALSQELAGSRRSAQDCEALAKRDRAISWTTGILCGMLIGLGISAFWRIWVWR